MINSRKRGFTLVELVIVIAVVAILAAVLIPTFTSLIKKANMSADEVAVTNMNKLLTTSKIVDGEIDSLSEVRQVLLEGGFNGDNLVPTSKNCSFYWSKTYNIVFLVDCTNEDVEDWVIISPTKGYEEAITEFTSTNLGVLFFNLANVPNATVTRTDISLKPATVYQGYPVNLSELPLDISLTFSAQESYEEAEAAPYGNWAVDFIISSNKKTSDYPNTQFYMAGQYDIYNENWVVVDVTDVDIEPGIKYPVVYGITGFQFNYVSVCQFISTFQCAFTTIGEVPHGLEITLQLVMYETTPTNLEEYANPDYIVYEITHKYE